MQSSPQDVHIDGPLTDISIKYYNAKFIAEKIFPIIQVKKQSNLFWKYGMENFNVIDAARAPGDEAREIYSSRTTDSYFCSSWSIKKKVTDEEKENADTPLDPEIDAAEDATEQILLNKEIRVKNRIYTALNAASNYTTISAGSRWDTDDGGDPDKDILAAHSYIHGKVYQESNFMIIPFPVAVALTSNPKVQELVKHTVNIFTIPGTTSILPNPLWGHNILIAGAGYNTANPAQDQSNTYIWGNDVIVAYVNNSPGLKRISLGYCFQWKGREVKKWYKQENESTYIKVEEKTDEKVVCPNTAYIIKSVIN